MSESTGTTIDAFPKLHFPEKRWRRCAFSPAEDLLALGGHGVVSIWDLEKRSLSQVIHGKRNDAVNSLTFSADGTRICVNFQDEGFGNEGMIRVFKVSTGERDCVLKVETTKLKLWGALPNGLIVASTGTHVELWDLSTGERTSSFKVRQSEDQFKKIESVAYDSSGLFLTAAKSDDDEFRVYDLKSAKRIGTCFGGHDEAVRHITASDHASLVHSIDAKGNLFAWSIPEGKILGHIELGVIEPTALLSIRRSNQLVVSGWSTVDSERGIVLFVDANEFKVTQRFPMKSAPWLTISCKGKLLATEVDQGGVMVVDTQSVDLSPEDANVLQTPESAFESKEWDEDLDSCVSEELAPGVFDPDGWTLSTNGEIAWSDFLQAVGHAVDAALLSDDAWKLAQRENRVLTIEHAGNGLEYIGRVGLTPGPNFCRVVVGQSLPQAITVSQINVSEIDNDFDDAENRIEKASKRLIHACIDGDASEARRAIAMGAELKETNRIVAYLNGYTPLRVALDHEHAEIVQILLDSGVDAFSIGYSDGDAWAAAVLSGMLDTAKLLQDAGFDTNALDVLVHACQHGKKRSIKYLLGLIDSMDASQSSPIRRAERGIEHATPLTAAAYAGNIDVVELLLNSGASVEATDGNDISPWVAAASGGHTELCQLFESHGAKPDFQTAFVVAAARWQVGALEGLVARVEIDQRTQLRNRSVTAIEAALDPQYYDMHYAKIDEAGELDYHLRDAYEQKLQEELLRALLQNGAAADTVSEDGEPLVYTARNNYAAIRTLANGGANLDKECEHGTTALTDNASLVNSVHCLLYHGSDPNARDTDGTPAAFLMITESETIDIENAKWFIAYGVDLDATDASGRYLEQHCGRISNNEDEDDEYSIEKADNARELLALLSDEDKLKGLHGALTKKPQTPEEFDAVLKIVFEEFSAENVSLKNDSVQYAAWALQDFLSTNPVEGPAKLNEMLQHEDWRYKAAAALNFDRRFLSADEIAKLAAQLFEGSNEKPVLDAVCIAFLIGGDEVFDAYFQTLNECSNDSLLVRSAYLRQYFEARSDEIERTIAKMKPEDPDSLTGCNRLRAGAVLGVLGYLRGLKGDNPAAISAYKTAVKLNPSLRHFIWKSLAILMREEDDSLFEALSLHEQARSTDDLRERRAIFERMIDAAPTYPWSFIELAKLLITDPDVASRDASKAVKLATRTCEQNGWHHHEFLHTLAAAHAEAGSFAKAVEAEIKAIASSPPEEADRYQKALNQYKERAAI